MGLCLERRASSFWPAEFHTGSAGEGWEGNLRAAADLGSQSEWREVALSPGTAWEGEILTSGPWPCAP